MAMSGSVLANPTWGGPWEARRTTRRRWRTPRPTRTSGCTGSTISLTANHSTTYKKSETGGSRGIVLLASGLKELNGREVTGPDPLGTSLVFAFLPCQIGYSVPENILCSKIFYTTEYSMFSSGICFLFARELSDHLGNKPLGLITGFLAHNCTIFLSGEIYEVSV